MILKSKTLKNKVKFQLVDGIDIMRTYAQSNPHAPSCQTEKKAVGATLFYKYVEGLACARLMSGTSVLGRALVWTATNYATKAKEIIVDTLYTTCDNVFCKKCDVFGMETELDYELTDCIKDLFKKVRFLDEDPIVGHRELFYTNVGHYKGPNYPYLDTFCILSPDRKILSTGYLALQGINKPAEIAEY